MVAAGVAVFGAEEALGEGVSATTGGDVGGVDPPAGGGVRIAVADGIGVEGSLGAGVGTSTATGSGVGVSGATVGGSAVAAPSEGFETWGSGGVWKTCGASFIYARTCT